MLRRATERAGHWDDVYRTKALDQVSWFQPHASTSLRLLTGTGGPGRSVLDVGAGASPLVDDLLAAGYGDVTVLDVSAAALDVVRARLGDDDRVRTVVADLLSWEPDRTWDAWHDRAVFHFLVEPADRATYARVAARAVAPGGVAVIGSFGPDGPESCSGLPTARHDSEGIAEELGPAFRLEASERELHRTPSGAEQAFAWAVLRRVGPDRS